MILDKPSLNYLTGAVLKKMHLKKFFKMLQLLKFVKNKDGFLCLIKICDVHMTVVNSVLTITTYMSEEILMSRVSERYGYQ